MSSTINSNLKYINLSTGGALVFTLQSGALTAASGDKTYALSASLSGAVSHFDVCSQVLNNKTQICLMVITEKDKTAAAYLSGFFEASDSNMTAYKQWTSYPIDASLGITPDTIGPVAVSSTGMAIAVNPAKGDAFYCVLNISANKWVKYNLPENAPTIQYLLFGTVYGNGGLFSLLAIDGSQTLMFQSFTDPKYEKTSHYRYDCSGKTILKLDAVKRADNNTGLYALYNKGIYLYETPNSDREDVLIPEDDFLFEDFAIQQFDGEAKSVLALEKEDQQYSTDKKAHYTLAYENTMFPGMLFSLVWDRRD